MTNQDQTIAVTRNGRGDLWLFSDLESALRHPLIQYGDAVMAGPSHIKRMYNKLTINDLLEKLDDEIFRVIVMQDISSCEDHSRLDIMYSRHRDGIWKRMLNVARTVPDDPGEVFKQIVYDRDNYNHGLKETTMNDSAPENKTEKAPRAPKYSPDSKIKMLADKEGKAYGKDNNPKRAGSKSAERFAHYGNGVTVKAFLDAGGTTADIDNDVKKAFIKVE